MPIIMPPKQTNRSSSKMSRPSKVFLKADRDGLLTDTLSISDVVNFDCYESIVSSVQDIVASFIGVSSECIGIDAVFYYKKRARSSRMNPVRIFTTTDVFRAVAEHPTGEVPLGVLWTKKIIVKVEPKTEESSAAVEEEVAKALSPAQGKSISTNDSEIPEKRRRLESPTYNYTYTPVGAGIEDVPSTIRVKASSRQRPPATAVSSSQEKTATTENVTTAGNQQKVLLGFPPIVHVAAPNKEKVINIGSGSRTTDKHDTEEEQEKRYPYKSQYQWPDHANCEVVMNYDGITERKTLIPGLSFVVQCLLKGNYSVLSREVAASLCLTKLSGSSQETLNDLNHTINSNRGDTWKEPTQRAPIKYLRDAKSEIFKVLSLLNLSKARFKELLGWMKSLKLEEGKPGKFYLSERSLIGNGLQVEYDSNEEAAMKLNQIYKNRVQSHAAKVLHPIDPTPAPTIVNPSQVSNLTMKQQEGSQKQIMFLMPQSGSTGELINLQTTSIPAGQKVTLVNSTNPTSLAGVQNLRTSHGHWEIRNNSLVVPSDAQLHKVNQAQKDASETRTLPGHVVPSILRRKQKHPVQRVQGSTSPVPMHLYKAQQNESDTESAKSETAETSESTDLDPHRTLPFVKLEPVDYHSDTTEDFDRTSDKGMSPSTALFGDTDKRYLDVLKSDAQMPQSSEQNDKPFDVVVKSEPLDDY